MQKKIHIKYGVEFFKNLPEWNDQEGYILDFFKSNFLFTEQRLEILPESVNIASNI